MGARIARAGNRSVAVLLLLFLFFSVQGFAQNKQPFPAADSKKGLQVQMVEDALALGIKHAALNVNFSQLIRLAPASGHISRQFGNREFHFNRAYAEQLDAQIKRLSDKGVIVSLILLCYRSSDEALNRIMLHPGYDPATPNNLSAFNTTTPEATAYFKACVEFLARRYSREDEKFGRAWNFIVGNEVNSHWFWANMGRVTMEQFADDYLETVRACHEAVRRHSLNARVYVSLEHHWNIRYPGGDELQAFAGKPFIEYFAKRARETGDFDWHVAFHPYPEDLFNPRTWNDKSATDSPETPRITFKNIEVLPRYLARPEMLFNGKQRRIILSEQGFHSVDSEEGQLLQAAAYCYAWERIANLDTIDSFILHRHVDHGNEGGLNLGLWTRKKKGRHPADPDQKKKIYEVFEAADTPEREKAFQFALPIIGLKSWDEAR